MERLHALAGECKRAKLYGARAEVYETLLRVAPDDATARKWCRYRRTDAGWVRDPKYKVPKDRGRGRERVDGKHAAWTEWFAEATAALATDLQAKRHFAVAREALHFALDFAPDDTLLRATNGEVRMEQESGAVWVLKETFSALKRRPALHEVARRAVRDPPQPDPGHTSDTDPLDKVPMGSVWQGPHIRLLGTADDQELIEHFARCEAVWPVFETAFGMEAPVWESDVDGTEGLTVCAFVDAEVAMKWLSAIPGVSEEFVAFARPLAAVAVPGRTAILVQGREPGIRLEAGPRIILDSLCRTVFGISVDKAWVSEGLNNYLSWTINRSRLVGTLSAFANRTKPAAGAPSPLLPTTLPADDWLTSGYALLAGDAKPDFHLMVGKHVNVITAPEMLYGYCVVAYLVEGRPSDAPAFLEAVGAGQAADVEHLLAEHLRLDVAGLEERVQRWLAETTQLSAAKASE